MKSSLITYRGVLPSARIDKQIPETPKGMNKTKIVIAGGGFAGLAAATYLNRGRELTENLRLNYCHRILD
jgi:NADPH-dependent 2,4-dienoyl-CoA reductase/sulfur reductase-like enzyme